MIAQVFKLEYMYTHLPTNLAYFRININDLTMFVTLALYYNKLPNLLFRDEQNECRVLKHRYLLQETFPFGESKYQLSDHKMVAYTVEVHGTVCKTYTTSYSLNTKLKGRRFYTVNGILTDYALWSIQIIVGVARYTVDYFLYISKECAPAIRNVT